MVKISFRFSVVIALIILSGCGGGSSGAQEPLVIMPNTYPLEKAYKDLIAKGWTVNYDLSGSCTGTAVRNEPPPVINTFKGILAYSITSTITINATSCTGATVTVTAVHYNDTDLNPLGYVNPGLEYAEYVPSPITIPSTVKGGDAATLGVAAIFVDDTKTTAKGVSEFSYVIESVTLETAIVTLVEKRFDLSAQLVSTAKDRYLIDTNGNLTPLSLEVQNSGSGGTDQLIFTPQ